jgi:hypothetical protein
MKKLLVATLCAISASAAFSQGNINKGDWMLGGSAGFNSSKYGAYKATNFGLSPDAGYFFMRNLAAGMGISISTGKSKDIYDETTGWGFGMSPFVRYYFLRSSEKINLFADGSFGYTYSKTDGRLYDYKGSSTMFAIKAGPAIFLTPATALELTIGYSSIKVKDIADTHNNFGFSAGFQIHIPGIKKK